MSSFQSNKIRVLIVEDSPTMSVAMKDILNSDPEIMVVGAAKNGQEAIDMTRRLKPDLITMDVHLPLVDGLEATKEIMAVRPTPIVIVSGSTFTNETEKVFNAISFGALEVINKNQFLSPKGGGRPTAIIEKLKFFSRIKVIRHPLGRLAAGREPGAEKRASRSDHVVAFVGSTGGPKAIDKILQEFPRDFSHGILVVIHIASGFDKGLVEWLRRDCAIEVKVAKEGEPIKGGIAYVAPSDFHLRVNKDHRIELGNDAPRMGLKPCGEYLLESVAEHYGEKSMGVILTGMGKDGSAGIQKIKKAGGMTIAQDEATSTIFGMPRVAIETGSVDEVLPLERIAGRIIKILGKGK